MGMPWMRVPLRVLTALVAALRSKYVTTITPWGFSALCKCRTSPKACFCAWIGWSMSRQARGAACRAPGKVQTAALASVEGRSIIFNLATTARTTD
eukprot:1144196-Pelagomonas_calceolata.AAC.5